MASEPKVTIQERHYADGRIERKIGDGDWEDVPNPHGRPVFTRIDRWVEILIPICEPRF